MRGTVGWVRGMIINGEEIGDSVDGAGSGGAVSGG